MNSDYKQFQVFNNIETLNTFTNLLSDNKIDFEVENNSKIFDPSFANNDFEKEYIVKIHPNDFEKVYDLEEEIIKNEIQNTRGYTNWNKIHNKRQRICTYQFWKQRKFSIYSSSTSTKKIVKRTKRPFSRTCKNYE